MADIQPDFGNSSGQQSIQYAQWNNIADGDNALPMAWSNLADKTVQVFGTLDGDVTIQGSNDPRVNTNPGSAVWETLTDNLGNPLVFAASGIKLIVEAPRFVRPLAGTGLSDATIIIVANAS